MNHLHAPNSSDDTGTVSSPQPARRLALASILVGSGAILLLSVPAGIIAIALGVKAKKLGHTTPMPKIAIVLGIVSLVASLFVYVLLFSYVMTDMLPTLYPGIFQKSKETEAELTVEETYDFVLQEDGTYALAVADGVMLSEICTVPAEHGGIAITAIADDGFRNQTLLSQIQLPDSILTIGNHAFENCDHVYSLTLGANLTSIGESAFAGCVMLETLAIPDGVTEIKSAAFAGCVKLQKITLPPMLTRIEAELLRDCAGLTKVVIPKGVVTIGSHAFDGCTELTELTLPDSVTTLGSFAFSRCAKLTRMNLPQDVSSIPEGLFLGCAALRKMPIPDGVTSIGTRAFANCFLLRDVTVPTSVTEIGDRAFDGCPNISKLQYVGTMAEWEQVRKPASWPDTMQSITCSDGNVRLT